MPEPFDLDQCVAWENGELDHNDTVLLFADLVRTGHAWRLQGYYGRTAQRLIIRGWITPEGEVKQRRGGPQIQKKESNA
jgi:hypothetical protein